MSFYGESASFLDGNTYCYGPTELIQEWTGCRPERGETGAMHGVKWKVEAQLNCIHSGTKKIGISFICIKSKKMKNLNLNGLVYISHSSNSDQSSLGLVVLAKTSYWFTSWKSTSVFEQTFNKK